MEESKAFSQEDKPYVLFEREEGLYLKISFDKVELAPTLNEEILAEIKQRQITHIEEKIIAAMVQNQIKEPVNLLSPEGENAFGQFFTLRIRRDRLEALLEIKQSLVDSEITFSDLFRSLVSSEIVFGIQEEALLTALAAEAGAKIPCAKGILPQKGADAFLRYHVDLEQQGKPLQREDGSSDLKNIRRFLNVNKGDLLVERIPPEGGIDGVDIWGLPIAAKPGKDTPLHSGKNTELLDDCHLIASIDGQLHIRNQRIQVLPVLEIEADVDYSTGNIDFVGSVIVRGSLQCGFSIKAAGNVEIYGSLCGGAVEASRLIVHKGIQGMNRTVIKVREWIEATFIENAVVYANQTILVKNAVMNSQLFAGVAIIVEGKRGLVIGGRLSAGQEIRVTTAGNGANVPTDLEISGNPVCSEELRRLRLALKRDEAIHQEVERSLAYFVKQGLQALSTERRAMYEKLCEKYQQLNEEIGDTKERIEELQRLLASLEPGKIHVYDALYPGVRIVIGYLRKHIIDALSHLTIYVHDDDLCMTSYNYQS